MTDSLDRREDAGKFRSLSRAMSLLRALAHRNGEPARLACLVEASGLHRATAHRVLAALVREGLVQQDSDGYALGPEIWMLGRAAAKRFDLAALAQPSLDRIAERTNDVALLFVRSGTSGVCVARREGTAPIIPGTTRVGTVKPLGVGAGCIALLAALDPEEAEAIVEGEAEARMRAYPGFTPDFVRGEVEAARDRGFSVDDQVVTPGVTAVGVAIRDWRGRPIAAFSCTAFAQRLPPEGRPALAAMLRAEAEEITRRLGPHPRGPRASSSPEDPPRSAA